MKDLIKEIENLGWNVYEIEKDRYQIGQYSPANQDFNIIVDSDGSVDGFIRNLYQLYEHYDPSEEASYWLDDTGHGTNGAPYDMGDLYNDMVACENMILDLYNSIINYTDET